mmetsp:Transcript_12980/g.51765  ORF Transcript_12980/g.51765 Transcript_12980/m.51765 type:complete len:206 (-) Transcript_12980:566-1183(-)
MRRHLRPEPLHLAHHLLALLPRHRIQRRVQQARHLLARLIREGHRQLRRNRLLRLLAVGFAAQLLEDGFVRAAVAGGVQLLDDEGAVAQLALLVHQLDGRPGERLHMQAEGLQRLRCLAQHLVALALLQGALAVEDSVLVEVAAEDALDSEDEVGVVCAGVQRQQTALGGHGGHGVHLPEVVELLAVEVEAEGLGEAAAVAGVEH